MAMCPYCGGRVSPENIVIEMTNRKAGFMSNIDPWINSCPHCRMILGTALFDRT